jgi:branched-chain amino acid transport system ATP-binding protein
MKTIEIIQTEHQNLRAVLYSLEQLVEMIDQGKQPKFSAFHGLLTYIDRFLDRYHHPKENDYLFPALLKREPSCSDLIKELGRQHGQGERLFVELLKGLSAYEFSGENEYPAFRSLLLEYTQFQRDHAELEEKEILPQAKASLKTVDWQLIDAAFGEHRDPMFTPEWETEFSTLFDQLINGLPAPVGLGESWQE